MTGTPVRCGTDRRSRRAEQSLSVLHYVEEWLPLSESFVYGPLSHSRHRAFVLTRAPLVNTVAFPHADVASLSAIWPRAQRYVPQPVLTAWLVAYMATRRIRVVHVHFGYAIHDVTRARGLMGLPLVVSLWGHDVMVLPRERPSHYAGVLEVAEAVVVPSRFLAERALALGARPQALRVIPAGVDTRFFTPTPLPGGPPTALFVGRFVEKKGIDVLLRAWPSVRARVPGALLRVLGFGPLARLLRSPPAGVTVEEADPNRRGPQVRDAMRSAHVVVTPSHTAGNGDAESLLVVNLEAQAMGRPVVTTNHGGIPEFVDEGRTAIVVPENDDKALADALCIVLTDTKLAEALAAAGPGWASQFGLSIVTHQIDELYGRLAGLPR